jgi:L,D-transpeptidase YcbB
MKFGMFPKFATTLLFGLCVSSLQAFAFLNDENATPPAAHGGALVEGEATGAVAKVKAGGGPATTKTEVVQGKNQIPMLTPKSDDLMRNAENKYFQIAADGGFPRVPKGNYKKGSKGEGVQLLNQRLFLEGYVRAEATQGNFAAVFTSATQDAVNKFQRNRGLAVTGKVDAATIQELNIPVENLLATIRANIPRLDIYSQDLGNRYVVVNIPAQLLETVSDGHVDTRQNVIVGRPERPSPVVMTPLETVRFNPYWNAPVSIVEKDILPKLANGIKVLEDMNMKVFEGGADGPEVDPTKVKFTPANIGNYLFRQEPGPESAMKTAKIDFRSTFGIYLHDTPEPGLFKNRNRFYSSGCIRIEQMPMLVEWVLNGQDGFGESKIATMAETLERLDVTIGDQPQLRIAYLTAWPTSNGTVAFRKDVYDLDGSDFTVGQPMPVGINSPDGQRYVLKPLPRQLSVDAAEAEGFNLTGKKKGGAAVSAKKNLFGKKLFDAAKPIKGEVTTGQSSKLQAASFVKTEKVMTTKKPSGLFDWAAYRKEQAAAANAPVVKKKKTEKVASGDTKKKPNGKEIGDLKPKLKKPTLVPSMADPCAPDAKGKIPADCLPKKPAKKA